LWGAEKLVLDTSVLVEYILERSLYRPRVARLFEMASRGEVELYVSTVSLSEVLYVASRIYSIAGVEDPNMEALAFVEWVKKRVLVVGVNEDIALRAGELKKQLRIALPDCYVIATAEAVDAVALFKTIEKEMSGVRDSMKELNVRFIDEIEI